ncbi:MAG: hypothetical protein MSA09_03520 [Lachnospiraceae bacterium]|nr:hypothetical protein [Lachnospiraceae bacterium]
MREIIYRCNRCNNLITGTVHRIGATDENGEKTKYGALFDGTDLCDSCMEEVTLAVIAQIEQNDGSRSLAQEDQTNMKEEQDSDPERQQEKEAQDPTEPVTYQCSKVKKTCFYAVKMGAQIACDYINMEKHSRGCDPEACDKYKKVERKRGRKPKKDKMKDAKDLEAEVTD